MKKHLVIKYFDTYPEEEHYFDTEKEARDFVRDLNPTTSPKTMNMYRGLAEKED